MLVCDLGLEFISAAPVTYPGADAELGGRGRCSWPRGPVTMPASLGSSLAHCTQPILPTKP